MNSGMALVEILLTSTRPLPWIHIPFTIAFLACYLAVAYITRATQGFYRKYSCHPSHPFTFTPYMCLSVRFPGPTHPTGQGRSLCIRHRYCRSYHLHRGPLHHPTPHSTVETEASRIVISRGY